MEKYLVFNQKQLTKSQEDFFTCLIDIGECNGYLVKRDPNIRRGDRTWSAWTMYEVTGIRIDNMRTGLRISLTLEVALRWKTYADYTYDQAITECYTPMDFLENIANNDITPVVLPFCSILPDSCLGGSHHGKTIE